MMIFKKRINKGTDQNLFLKYLPNKLYYPLRGYAFEKFCYQHEHLIARRLDFLQKRLAKIPNPRKMTFERVLITASAPKQSLVNRGYFHHILTLDNIFGSGA